MILLDYINAVVGRDAFLTFAAEDLNISENQWAAYYSRSNPTTPITRRPSRSWTRYLLTMTRSLGLMGSPTESP